MNELEQALAAMVGKELGVSDWLQVDQDRIDKFAAATGDYQWIHVDTERARRELPGGATIAHGFLTLSLTAGLSNKISLLPGIRQSLNYGLNKVRFLAPVRSGQRVRVRTKLLTYEAKAGAYLTTWQGTVEIEGEAKAACVAETLALLHPAPA